MPTSLPQQRHLTKCADSSSLYRLWSLNRINISTMNCRRDKRRTNREYNMLFFASPPRIKNFAPEKQFGGEINGAEWKSECKSETLDKAYHASNPFHQYNILRRRGEGGQWIFWKYYLLAISLAISEANSKLVTDILDWDWPLSIVRFRQWTLEVRYKNVKAKSWDRQFGLIS